MRKGRLLFLSLFILLASGVVSHAEMPGTPLRANVGVKDVSGGEKTNPLWESEIGNDEFRIALKKALDSSGLLERAKGEGRFSLSAILESIDQSNLSGQPTTTRVKYTLTDKVTGKDVFQELISSEYGLETWDSIMRPKRLRRECESAARASSTQLTEKLLQLSLSQDQAALPH
jgi:hypothetical protein